MAGTAPAQRVNLLGPLQHGQALPHQASHSGQLPAVRVALRMHLEQTWSSSSLFARWDKCFCELCTGQRGVSGSAITQTISYTALLHKGVNKVWFLFHCTF